MPETHHEFLPGPDAESAKAAFEEGRKKEIEAGLIGMLEGAYVWVSSCEKVQVAGRDIMLYPEIDRSSCRPELRSEPLFPGNVYIRIVRAEATKEPRVDLFEVLDDSHAEVQHVKPAGSFFLSSVGDDIVGYRTSDEALCARILDLTRKVRKVSNKD